GNHLVLLAKNYEGYKNLMKLVSYGWTDGFYYKPRIDKELLQKYHTGLIALSACLNGVIAEKVLHEDNEAALKAIEEYKSIFGDDFYLELQRHPSGDEKIDKAVYQDQVYLNQQLVELAAKTGLKYVATNDVHFINKEDAAAHDRLLCLSTGKDLDDPNRMRYTQQEWFKTQQEMRSLFADLPEAIRTTGEIVDKVEEFELNSNPIMPDFPLPEGFENEDEYLKHITYEGAYKRYGEELPAETKERLDFELGTIQKMGFPGYFLIVWDFIRAAREMGVSVGPGRGSAAGSVVAYSLKITDIDPIKYDLLFERFLNPDRISMPDIDIDFDEDGREKVLEWVVNKYGKKRVAHIITFGTMAPKMAIRDVARVQKLELSEADRLAKMVPERPGTTFKKAFAEVQELKAEKNSANPLVAQTLKYAEVLEGSVRQTGVHACGIIIGKNDLEEHIPICINKDAELFVTQYDGKHVESVGMLKMDFLGLKTLSIIKDAVENIKLSRGEDVDISKISLEDPATFELYSKGETTALFQFESPGMKKHLRALKPNRFEDLIAMNALYRPGPMEYIPSFIARKHGTEKIVYDLPEMEEYLEDTYGITVYQEQVMLLSQKLAGFTKGQADSLRKAMGKKIKALMDELKVLFLEGCKKNGFDETVVNKIWKDWEAFAQYAFNKSHSTCYAYVSYQTAFLKAHYPAEFMAAVLSRNLNDIKKITFFMDECRRMGLSVLGPDVNESFSRFTVNKKGDIRFGMAAIKGVGGAAVEAIIKEREENGPYKDYYDFVERVNLTSVNKRCLENLITAGALDGFEGTNRHQFFAADENENSFLENLVRYGIKMQSENTSAPTLFGGIEAIEISKPVPPVIEEWPMLVKLNKEKELIGIYLSSHPLDTYKFELENLNTTPITALQSLADLKGREITIAGIVSQAAERFTKNGSPFGEMTLEDYTDSYRMVMFSKDYLRFK
ncbi:MAG TPA: DNA polymerase III subunit alpha, partial [Bacteroidales bacterium]|nr:DNA polymerase III subunit alpha [Bacteroidales bacterium]